MSSIRDQLKNYETSVGKRTGRLAITIDSGTVSALGCSAKLMKGYLREDGLISSSVTTALGR